MPASPACWRLPASRPSAFLGRSNWSADDDFEGSIRYIRIYDQALTPTEVGQNASATVTFDANGGTGSMTNQSSTTSAALTTNTFTRTGRTFAGWNTAANGSGTVYADAATYPFSSDVTLYAQWVPNAVGFVAVPTGRLYDSRDTASPIVGGGQVREIDVAGHATAVVLNVTATEPDGDGYMTAYACGGEIPLASNINFVAGQTVPNLVTVEVGPGGTVCLASSVATYLVVDASAALSPTGAAQFIALTPDRLVDTRASVRLAAGVPFELTVAGQGDVDADAVAVTLNVTVTGPAGDGYLTSFPCGATVPLASNLNFVAGQTVANAVTAELVDGKACFVSSVDTHLVVDVSGQYLALT